MDQQRQMEIDKTVVALIKQLNQLNLDQLKDIRDQLKNKSNVNPAQRQQKVVH